MCSFKNCNIANSFKLHVALIRYMGLIYFDLIRFKIHGPVDLQSRTISAREDSSPSELFQCNFFILESLRRRRLCVFLLSTYSSFSAAR